MARRECPIFGVHRLQAAYKRLGHIFEIELSVAGIWHELSVTRSQAQQILNNSRSNLDRKHSLDIRLCSTSHFTRTYRNASTISANAI
jgi:hypothetical protein